MNGRKIGVLIGYLAMFLQNISSFILTPLLILTFGDGDYGVYTLVLSISSYFALADLGISNSIVRYVSEYKARNDRLSESKFITLVLLVYILIGTLLLLIGVFIYYRLPSIFGKSLLVSEIELLKDLFFLAILNGVINLFFNLTSGIIKSYENFAFLKLLNISRTFVRFSVALLLLSFSSGPFTILLLDTILSLFLLIVTSIYCLRNLKIRFSTRFLDKKYVYEILSFSVIVFVDAIAFHFFWNADVFIIGIFLSSTSIAVYSIGALISNLFFSLSLIISEVIMPGIVTQVTMNASNYELTSTMIKIGRIKLITLALPVIGFIFLGKDFLILWVGEDFIKAYSIALLVIVPSMIAGIYDAGLYIMWAKKKHLIKSLVTLFISVINILLTILLVESMGIIGAAIGTSFAYTAGYIVFNIIFFHKILKLDMIRFAYETMNKLWIPIFLTMAFSHLLVQYGDLSLKLFILKVVLISVIYLILIWKFGLNEDEKLMLKNMVVK